MCLFRQIKTEQSSIFLLFLQEVTGAPKVVQVQAHVSTLTLIVVNNHNQLKMIQKFIFRGNVSCSRQEQ